MHVVGPADACVPFCRALQHRDLSAVLFRRYAFNYLDDYNSLWLKISPAAAQQIKANLLLALQNEKAERVLGRICNAVSEIMRFEQRQAGMYLCAR